MLRKISILIAISSVFIAFRCRESIFPSKVDKNEKDQLLMEVVLQSLKYNHYAPQNIDDELSSLRSIFKEIGLQ